MNALGSVWILMLVLLVTADAMGRSFFAHPIAGVTEMIQVSIVGIVFLQLADAIRNGKLTRADSFLSLLAARRPRAAQLCEGVFLLLGAVYMALALWGTVPLLLESIERKSYLGNQGVFTLIVWPIKAITALGLAACLVEFLRQAARALRRAKGA
ncbi:MAG: TRAP transporter small permease [Burkholderiaceae bacterium]|nr:TRAP transporter small permease [Burkholderiaceae bacterium]